MKRMYFSEESRNSHASVMTPGMALFSKEALMESVTVLVLVNVYHLILDQIVASRIANILVAIMELAAGNSQYHDVCASLDILVGTV